MKQTMLIKVCMKDDKCRAKAMKIAVGFSGVDSAAWKGNEKDELEVTGVVDSIKLTKKLRNKVGFSEIVSVGPIPEKKDEKKDESEKITQLLPYYYSFGGYGVPHYVHYEDSYRGQPYCSIM
ncbi:heavy metal-associated isoprenylated plant protein 16-like [Impatiens glandulifera]|uniref:heavy metal-associated isoprenylated plant protein 16-like n=1 Tax=Impatiens glandulifera TaxID=253017 RepID=UPI001FB09899|nr:heavy metal-associated isoprenylated plant protein 16-like [Impatiens glandulifera]